MTIYNEDEFAEEEEKPTLADQLVTLASGYGYFFLNQYGVPFVSIVSNVKKADNTYNTYNTFTYTKLVNNSSVQHTVKEKNVSVVSTVSNKQKITIMPLRSKRFTNWLSAISYKVLNKMAGPGSVSSVVSTLVGLTQEKNIRHKLYNRVAPDPKGNGIWIDMCDDNWHVIHVTEEGWKIEDKTPLPMFQRWNQGPLTVPKETIDDEAKDAVMKLLDFLNLKDDKLSINELSDDKLMAICVLISYFVPEIDHPVLGVSGAHGSAKSMLFEILKKIIDPLTKNPETETLSMSNDENGLAQQLYHVYFPCFDNVSSLKRWQSDMFCRGVTGAAILKRKLFSDDDDILYQFRRCIGLNGINVVARNSDLLDRTVLLHLEEIRVKRKKSEMLAEFEKEKSSILGGILTILSKALAIKKTIKIENYQRLADFHEWGCAISVALGYTAKRFSEAYANKVDTQNEEALSSSSIATALLEYLKDIIKTDEDTVKHDLESDIFTIEKTPTEWFKEVTDFAKKEGIKTSKGYWATNVNQFSRKLNEVEPNLKKAGVIMQRYSDGSNRSIIFDITGLMKAKLKPESEDDDLWKGAIEVKKLEVRKN